MQRILILASIALFLFGCSKEKRSDKASAKMQDFVMAISDYAHGFDADFIVIPQNGIELAFNNLDQNDGVKASYMNSIDGFGVEELFYDGSYSPDHERLGLLEELKKSKSIMVAEFVSNDQDVQDALERNYNEGFICFPRSSTNYDYLLIPDSIPHKNNNSISTLDEAQNYLYLISTDHFQSKQEMIHAIAETDYDLVLIDLFFSGTAFTSIEIEQLKTKESGASRLVIAYMNIGSAEKFRYYWKDSWGLHHPLWIRRKYEGYDDEFWVKFWKESWQEIIYGNDDSYTRKIINAGFDGVYLDNVEAYYFLYYTD